MAPAARALKIFSVSSYNRQHDHMHFGRDLFQAPDAFDAIDSRQVDIHQDHIRSFARDFIQRDLSIRVLIEAPKALRPVDQAREGSSHLFAVFNNGYGNGHNNGLCDSFR